MLNHFSVKCHSFVINIIILLGGLYLISIHLFLILISRLAPLIPKTVRTLNYFNSAAGHVITGNLKIISDSSDSRFRSIIAKDPKYRFAAQIDFQKCRENIAASIYEYCSRWCKLE